MNVLTQLLIHVTLSRLPVAILKGLMSVTVTVGIHCNLSVLPILYVQTSMNVSQVTRALNIHHVLITPGRTHVFATMDMLLMERSVSTLMNVSFPTVAAMVMQPVPILTELETVSATLGSLATGLHATMLMNVQTALMTVASFLPNVSTLLAVMHATVEPGSHPR